MSKLWMVVARREVPSGKSYVGRYVVAAAGPKGAKAVVAKRFSAAANVSVVAVEPVNGPSFYLGMERVA